jgi:hypothetical protein
LKPEHFISEIMLEGIRIRIVMSGSKIHAVPLIKFNTDLIEGVVTAATPDQEWHDAYNAAKNSNPSATVEYLHEALITMEGCGTQQKITCAK